MSTPVTDFAKRKKLSWALGGSALNGIFAYLTFGSSVLVLFLQEFGFAKSRIGAILSIFPFCGVLALVTAHWAERTGVKRVYITYYGLRKLIIPFLFFAPAVQQRFGHTAAFFFVAGVLLVFAAMRALAETAALSWSQEFVPRSIRGRFSARVNMVGGLAGLAALGVASYVLGNFAGIQRYLWLMIGGSALGFVGVMLYLPVPGGQATQRPRTSPRHWHEILDALQDRDYRRFLWGMAFHVVGLVALMSFMPIFMTEQIGLQPSQVVILDGALLVGGLLVSTTWGWAADRYGSRPVLISCLGILCATPIVWTFLPRHSPSSFPLAMAAALLLGTGFWGVAVGHGTLLFNRMVPPGKRTAYMAVYYTWAGITAGVAPLGTGFLLQKMQAVSPDPFVSLFMIAIAMLFISITFYTRITAEGHYGTRAFVGMFFQANPIQVFRTNLLFSTAREEGGRVAATRRIGDTRSALSEKELLRALHDPSFNVRFEAIVAAARMKPSPGLVDQLSDILRRQDAELSPAAAWALGCCEAREAIPALRQALDAPLPGLRQRAMRALGLLNDQPSVPRLLDIARTSSPATNEQKGSDHHAALCALASLRVRDAIPAALQTLESAPDRIDQHELAQAIAQMLNREDTFIRLWRNMEDDPGDGLATAVESVERRWRLLGQIHTPFLLELQDCTDRFARHELEPALLKLGGLLQTWPDVLPDRLTENIAQTCGRMLETGGALRIECAALALTALSQ